MLLPKIKTYKIKFQYNHFKITVMYNKSCNSIQLSIPITHFQIGYCLYNQYWYINIIVYSELVSVILFAVLFICIVTNVGNLCIVI